MKVRWVIAVVLCFWPVLAVTGKISKEGEIDYYSFEVEQGQELFFEVVSGRNLNPQLSLYQPNSSWFDPQGLRRLAFNREPNSVTCSPPYTKHSGSTGTESTCTRSAGPSKSPTRWMIIPASRWRN